MLQSIRDNMKGVLAFIIIAIMIVPLALFGVDSLFNSPGDRNVAAKVNGEKISENDLRRAISSQRQQMLARFGQNIPPEMLSDERLRTPVLNGLVDQYLLSQDAKAQSMAVSSADLDELIRNNPQFQQNGTFSPEYFRMLIANQGQSAAAYKLDLEQRAIAYQLRAGIAASNFAVLSEAEDISAISRQKRDFNFATLPMSKALESVSVSDEEVAEHYQDNQAQYMQPEQIAIEYIELTPAALRDSVEVSEDEIKRQYEQNKAEFSVGTERHAAHILFELKGDGSEQAVIAEVQAKLAAGEDFAELAKRYSEDVGSAQAGGDLGYSAGDTFPEAFEKTLAKLEVGQVSEPVTTDAGVHLIKLLDTRSDQYPSLDQQREAIVAALRQAKAEAAFTDKLEELSELSYNAEGLAEVAEQLGLQRSVTELFDRNGGSGILANPKVLETAFSDDVLVDGNVSQIIEISDTQALVLNVINRVEAHVKPLAEVDSVISEELKREKAAKLLENRAQELVSKVESGMPLKDLVDEGQWQQQTAVDRTNSVVDQGIVRAVFNLPKPSAQPVVSDFALANGDRVVLQLSNVTDGLYAELSADEKQALLSQIAQNAGQSDIIAYRANLKQAAEIEVR